MVVMGAGIVIGALIGALTFTVGGVPLSLSTSGGALIAGLVCGWLRSVNRTFGRIPAPALWVFNNIGLNTFIAVVGISAGPGLRRRAQGPGTPAVPRRARRHHRAAGHRAADRASTCSR